MEPSELAEQQHCRPYFPVGCSLDGDLADSGEWPFYAAYHFPGACALRFHKQPLEAWVELIGYPAVCNYSALAVDMLVALTKDNMAQRGPSTNR